MTTTYEPAAIVDALAAFGQLPDWLAAGMDPRRVAEALEERVPELHDGRLRLRACTPDLLRAKDDEWHARYTLTVAEPAGESREVVLVGNLWQPGRERPAQPAAPAGFGQPGWRCALVAPRLDLRVETADDALPALPRLADPVEAARLIEPVLHEAGHPGARIASCRPTVARYKPGSRCTVVVGLDYSAVGSGSPPPDRVVLKTHHGGKGEAAWEAMTALWQRRTPWSGAVRLAEPLGYLADDRILVQGPVPGDRILKDLVRPAVADGDLATFRAELAATARGIAAIHTSGVTYGSTDSIEDELDKVREVVDRLAASAPELALSAVPVVGMLADLARETDPDPVVPCHHDFRPAQVLLDGDGVSFVDFDGACMAEPALDIGRFRAKLRDTAISACDTGDPRSVSGPDADLRLIDRLCEEFLSGYQEHAAVSRERVLLWETCDLVTSLLHAWTKVRLERVQARLALLVHQIEHGGLLDSA